MMTMREPKIRGSIICFFSVLLSIASIAFAASASQRGERIMERVYDALRRADFTAAQAQLDSAFANYFRFPPYELAELHTLQALLSDYKGDKEAVLEHLELALQLNPGIKLDPLFFSPELQQTFERLKNSKAQQPRTDVSAPQIRYMALRDQRIDAAWRSLVLPGWGQIYKGQRKRGYTFAAITGGLAVATATVFVMEKRAENDYLEEVDPNLVPSKYDTYNRFYVLRHNLLLATGIAWALNFLDALFTLPPQSPLQAVSFRQRLDPAQRRFVVQARFRID